MCMRNHNLDTPKKIFKTLPKMICTGVCSLLSVLFMGACSSDSAADNINSSSGGNRIPLVFTSCEPESDTIFQAGNGSTAYPYAICNLQQLGNTGTKSDLHYVLGQDIDANQTGQSDYNEGQGWKALSLSGGSFDGKGYAVSNISINHSNAEGAQSSGFFKSILQGATVRNLGIKDISIMLTFANTSQIANLILGCFASFTYGQSEAKYGIHNSYATGDIMVTSPTNNSSLVAEIGGLIGRDFGNGSITNSYADCDITLSSTTSSGSIWAGALAGTVASATSISNSYAAGTFALTSANNAYLGGLIGSNSGASFLGSNYYVSTEGQNGIGTNSACDSANCIQISLSDLQNLDETAAPLGWDSDIWASRTDNLACLKNASPDGQTCP